jgi:hypothetical protein
MAIFPEAYNPALGNHTKRVSGLFMYGLDDRTSSESPRSQGKGRAGKQRHSIEREFPTHAV